MSIDRWMDKEDLVHIHCTMKYYSWKNSVICSTMDGPRDYHTKWLDQKEKDKYDITYLWTQKNDRNELIYKTETDSQT